MIKSYKLQNFGVGLSAFQRGEYGRLYTAMTPSGPFHLFVIHTAEGRHECGAVRLGWWGWGGDKAHSDLQRISRRSTGCASASAYMHLPLP